MILKQLVIKHREALQKFEGFGNFTVLAYLGWTARRPPWTGRCPAWTSRCPGWTARHPRVTTQTLEFRIFFSPKIQEWYDKQYSVEIKIELSFLSRQWDT